MIAKTKTLWIEGDVKSCIENLLKRNCGSEVCGLLEGMVEDNDSVVVNGIVPFDNHMPYSFEMDFNEFQTWKTKAKLNGKKIVGLYHSHPFGDTRPSFRDLMIPKFTELLLLIISLSCDKTIHAASYGFGQNRIFQNDIKFR